MNEIFNTGRLEKRDLISIEVQDSDLFLRGLEESDELSDWKRGSPKAASKYGIRKPPTADIELSARLTFAALSLRTLIDINPEKAGGSPVLSGTRFKISQVLAEIADGKSVKKLARDFNLDAGKISETLHAISIYLDRKIAK